MYMLFLLDAFFNRQSVFPLVPTVLFFLPRFVRSWPHATASPEKRKKQATFFNFELRYIDDVISLNNW